MDTPINEEVAVRSGGPKSKGTPEIYLVSVHVRDLLNVRRLQGRLTVRQTAALLNCGENDVPVLASHGLIKPLGHPEPGTQKYYSPVEVLQMAGDAEKMGKVCDVLYKHWQDKNAAKSAARHKRGSNGNGDGEAHSRRWHRHGTH